MLLDLNTLVIVQNNLMHQRALALNTIVLAKICHISLRICILAMYVAARVDTQPLFRKMPPAYTEPELPLKGAW